MFSSSLRWRLPLTYAGLALLTAALLNVILLVTLLLYYRTLEQRYLMRSGMSSSAALASALAAGAEPAVLEAQAQALARLYDVRLRLRAADGGNLLDTGQPIPLPLATQPAIGDPAALLNDEAVFLEAAYGFDRLRRTDEEAEITLQAPASGQPLGWLLVSEGPAYGQDIVASVARAGTAASLAAVLLAAGAGWLVSRRMVAPLLALTETSTRMAQGDLAARAGIERGDEIGALAESFNRMAGRVEDTVQTLRRFTADAAHELHTPLTALATDLELAAGEANPVRAQALVARARAQTERLAALSADLLDLSRLEGGSPPTDDQVELVALLHELGETFASRAEQAELAFDLDTPAAPVSVRGHAGQIRRAVSNLLDNALKFTPAGGRVGLRLAAEAGGVRITVCDTGIGIPDEDVPRLWGRFHRGRNAGGYSGSGLGLAIVRVIMEQHGGSVGVQSGPEGTLVALWWPARDR